MKTSDILASLPEDWRKTVLGMYDEGCSDREVMRELDLTPSKWRQLESDVLDSEDFAELVEYGRMLSAAWWERQGRINLSSPAKDFNTNLWLANVKERLGWGSGTAVSEAIEMSGVDNETLTRQIRDLMNKFENGPNKATL